MVQPAGMTRRTIGRISGRHFIDQVEVERWKGKVDEVDTYEPLGLFNGRLLENSGFQYGQQDGNQAYTSTVIVVGGPGVTEPDDRYRVKVVQYKSRLEMSDPEGMAEIKRVRYLDVQSCQTQQDNRGTDVMWVLRCKNGEPW